MTFKWYPEYIIQVFQVIFYSTADIDGLDGGLFPLVAMLTFFNCVNIMIF